jgi:hypothetical protein
LVQIWLEITNTKYCYSDSIIIHTVKLVGSLNVNSNIPGFSYIQDSRETIKNCHKMFKTPTSDIDCIIT